MTKPKRWPTLLAAIATAWALAACGGGGGSSVPPVVASVPDVPQAGAPASVGNTAIDGRNWLNYRRSQVGISVLAQSTLIDRAAQNHSDYQKLNNQITHDETAGKPGYTGTTLLQRLNAAGYNFAPATYAFGEVISATSNNSGAYMAEELITAIYHRFVIFEPQFKEIGSGAASTGNGYNYFTADFAANNGYGPGLGRGKFVTWPYNGQTAVTPNFFSDYEAPDPVPTKNEVGYPISVHADFGAVLTVGSFTIQPHGGQALDVRLLQHATDQETPQSAAAIVPMSVLMGATTYDVTFSGIVDGVAATKSWSFTTK